jgi:ketosteroid isomerase-like protein
LTRQTEDSRAIAESFVKAIGDGRLDDVRRLLHDDVVAHATAGVPFSGDYYGHDGFFGLLAKIFEVLEVSLDPDIRYIADEENVVLYYRLTLTSRSSGKTVEMRVAEVLALRDGLIAELDVFYKDPVALATILAA